MWSKSPLKVVNGPSETLLQMVSRTPASDLPDGLLEWLLDGPLLSPARIAAGRRRAADGPVDAVVLADAVVAEVGRAPATLLLVRD